MKFYFNRLFYRENKQTNKTDNFYKSKKRPNINSIEEHLFTIPDKYSFKFLIQEKRKKNQPTTLAAFHSNLEEKYIIEEKKVRKFSI